MHARGRARESRVINSMPSATNAFGAANATGANNQTIRELDAAVAINTIPPYSAQGAAVHTTTLCVAGMIRHTTESTDK